MWHVMKLNFSQEAKPARKKNRVLLTGSLLWKKEKKTHFWRKQETPGEKWFGRAFYSSDPEALLTATRDKESSEINKALPVFNPIRSSKVCIICSASSVAILCPNSKKFIVPEECHRVAFSDPPQPPLEWMQCFCIHRNRCGILLLQWSRLALQRHVKLGLVFCSFQFIGLLCHWRTVLFTYVLKVSLYIPSQMCLISAA